MDFNWKEFEEQKIVVHCSTLEEEKDFLNECNKRGYKRYDGCLLEFDGYYYHCEKIKNICSGLMKIMYALILNIIAVIVIIK